MKNDDFGTIGGEPITQEMIAEFVSEFERDWDEAEIEVKSTSYGRALSALQSLDLTVEEIEALERRAKHEQKPLSFFLRSVLQDKLAG
ncbi:MAG: hypothetical protein LBJ21_00770 [Acidobacteriota bacterium]|jgi:hypothetical protein|nr:hypothetical protein [Acidobacteriota bacterium]